MKIKLYKAKSLDGFEVEGFIYQQPDHTRYCMGEDEPINLDTYIIVPTPGDWGLPYSMTPKKIDTSTLEEIEERDIN